MNKKISFYTFGCRLNQSETAVIEQTFRAKDYNVVTVESPADIAVINTCTVTENGDAETRRLVNKLVRINPEVKIALVGCQAQVEKGKLTELPNVRWVVGNAMKMDLQSIVEELDQVEPRVITPTISREPFTMPMAPIDRSHKRANIKIQDGCDFFCSFCEIPYARGRARSREMNDILKEAKTLAEAGYKEIVITGINVGTYSHEKHQMLDVFNALAKIEGIKRLRLSSIEPTTIPYEFFELMNDPQSKICRYLHIPLQSGSDDILTAMKRKYTTKEFENFINHARKTVPAICIGTDVIVGFPGETDQHFAETEEHLRNWPIDYFHVFSYSNRDFAKSKELGNHVPSKAIHDRSEQLRQLSERKRQLFYNSLLGTTQNVLFENEKNGWWNGLTDNYVRVHTQSANNLTNIILPVSLESEANLKVLGKIAA